MLLGETKEINLVFNTHVWQGVKSKSVGPDC